MFIRCWDLRRLACSSDCSPAWSFSTVIAGDQFVLYCMGSGILLMSSAIALRILFVGTKKTERSVLTEKHKWEPIPDPTSDGLNERLTEFAATRFASPIVQRHLTEGVGVNHGHPVPLIPRHPMIRPPVRLPQRRIKPEKVVQLPMKQWKDGEDK